MDCWWCITNFSVALFSSVKLHFESKHTFQVENYRHIFLNLIIALYILHITELKTLLRQLTQLRLAALWSTCNAHTMNTLRMLSKLWTNRAVCSRYLSKATSGVIRVDLVLNIALNCVRPQLSYFSQYCKDEATPPPPLQALVQLSFLCLLIVFDNTSWYLV